MAAKVKTVVDPVMGGQEALNVTSWFEAFHLPLSPSCRLVRVLGSVVQSLTLPVLDAGHDLSLRGVVARWLVGDQDAWGTALLPQQLAQQVESGSLIAPALDHNVERHAVLVHSTPGPVLHAHGFDYDLLTVPLVAGTGQPAANLVGKRLAELERPLSHGLMADHDAASGEDFVHVS